MSFQYRDKLYKKNSNVISCNFPHRKNNWQKQTETLFQQHMYAVKMKDFNTKGNKPWFELLLNKIFSALCDM